MTSTEPAVPLCEKVAALGGRRKPDDPEILAFYRETAGRVRRCLLIELKKLSRFVPPHNIQEAVDVSLMRFIERCAAGENIQGPIAWMCKTTAKNHLIDLWRKERRWEEGKQQPPADDPARDPLDELAHDAATPEEALQSDEFQRCMDEALGELKTLNLGYYEVIIQVSAYGKKPGQIAKEQNVAAGTIRERLSQARKQLRKILASRCPDHTAAA